MEDLTLRPPLVGPQLNDQHNDAVKQLISRLFVASRTLRLGMETRFCAVVLWHRYVGTISLRYGQLEPKATSSDMAWAAAACLFLACKSEEEPRRLRDVINACHMFFIGHHQSTSTWVTVSTDDSASKTATTSTVDACHNHTNPLASNMVLRVSQYPPPLDGQYWYSKESIVRAEETVLRWLGFDASVSKPHRAVCCLLQEPEIVEAVLQRRKVTYDQIVPVAWRRLNDALCYAQALQHPVLALAAASVELALGEIAPILSATDELSCPWWLMLEVSGAGFVGAKNDLQRAAELSRSPCSPTNEPSLVLQKG